MALYEKDAMVTMLAPKEKLVEAWADLKRRVATAELDQQGPMRAIAEQSHRMRGQITDNLRALDAAEFSEVLRPVFQKDEWKLLLAGGVIGAVIGVLQYVFLFGGSP
jgi:hypothetical protein